MRFCTASLEAAFVKADIECVFTQGWAATVCEAGRMPRTVCFLAVSWCSPHCMCLEAVCWHFLGALRTGAGDFREDDSGVVVLIVLKQTETLETSALFI